jgi:spore coat polysaccharide biosynthesis predicted glycosyltransferase SpsG
VGASVTAAGTSIFFWVEVSRKIGMGHLMQSVALAEELRSGNVPTHFIIPRYEPARRVLRERGLDFTVAPFRASAVHAACDRLSSPLPRPIVLHHWHHALDAQRYLRRRGYRVAVFDQCGGKNIDCDLLVNSSPLAARQGYSFAGRKPRLALGPRYAVLRSEFAVGRRGTARRSSRRPAVLVTMGGVDRTGATMRIVEALKELPRSVRKIIVLGPGFPHLDRLKRTLDEKRRDFEILSNPGGLARLLRGVNLAISAGGGTLFELACAGTPGLVLWEDEHERVLGEAFARLGTVLCVGNGMAAPLALIGETVNALLGDRARRLRMSARGRTLVDGRGAGRIARLLLSLARR